MDINKLYLSFDKNGNAYLAVPALSGDVGRDDIYNYLSTLEIELSNDKYHKLDNRYLHDIVWNDDGSEDNNVIKNRTHWREIKEFIPMHYDGGYVDYINSVAVHILDYTNDETFDMPEYVRMKHSGTGETYNVRVYDGAYLGDSEENYIETAHENNGMFCVYSSTGNSTHLTLYILEGYAFNELVHSDIKVEVPIFEYHQLDLRYLPDTTKYSQLLIENASGANEFQSLIKRGFNSQFTQLLPNSNLIFALDIPH